MSKNMQKWSKKCHICLQSWAMEIGTPSIDVGPSEHDGASPKQGESGRLAVE